MKRGLRPEELKLWAIVAATVRPAAGRSAPAEPPHSQAPTAPGPPAPIAAPAPTVRSKPRPAPAVSAPADIEPGRKRRIVRERDPIDRTLDLHGLDQDRARAALLGFLSHAQSQGERAVLVITGKGSRGDGVLRRHTPDWLADPSLRPVVAGWSFAHRRHGGEGAIYVALKRRG
ncbi:MAG TPA: Smr/MutS family protein [Caulobacteraceae bacterium]|nr:Smr/MutS family protein [Caulobacteraceae bacterium]